MATKRWLGVATAVSDLWTVTLSGTVASQTYSININNKSIQFVAGTSDTVSTILAGLQAVWNASQIPEFAELTASATPAAGPYTSLVLTGNTAGNPAQVSLTTSGSASFAITHTVSATGPNDFANAQNWSGGSAPANSDTLVFDNGTTSCKYNLNTSLTGVTLVIEPGYAGEIGLPLMNADGSILYAEYRTKSLTLAGANVTINAPLVRRCHLDFGANTANLRVLATGTRLDQYVPAMLVTGGNSSSEMDLSKGDVGVAFYLGQTANFPIINTSYLTSEKTDVRLICGPGCSLAAISKNGGALTTNSDVSNLNQAKAGGTTTIAAGSITNLNLANGTAVYNSTGTLGTASISGRGLLDFNQDTRPKTVTNPILLYGNHASVQDDQKVVNGGVLSVNVSQAGQFNISHGDTNTCSFT